jgi:assimilatory nitrate reductase electron transfer subunit
MTQHQKLERILIIGFGPVAASLIEGLLPGLEAGLFSLDVISAEQHAAYNRVLLAEVASGATTAEHLAMIDPLRLLAAGVGLHLGASVTRVDRSRRQVHLGSGQTLGYERLIFATGARPVVPTLNGLDFSPHAEANLPAGVMALRTLEDAMVLNRVLNSGGRVLILGGGILGIEAALAMAEAGHRPVLVHHGHAPLGRSVDSDGGMLLARSLRAAGVEVISGVRATAVRRDADGFSALVTEAHGEITGDALLLSCGVRARTELAAGCGLKVGRGIKTNEHLVADTENRVFALGDCAEVAGAAPSGLLAPGWAQAAWLANFLLTHRAPAPDLATTALDPASAAPLVERTNVLMLKGQSLELVVAGNVMVGPWDEGQERVSVFADPQAGRYLKLVTEHDVLTGFLAIGLPRTGAEMVLAFERGTVLPEDRSALLRLDDPAAPDSLVAPSADDQLCRCSGATHGQVAHAVTDGCTTVAEVGAACRAGTGCGGCRETIEAMLRVSIPV